VSIDPFGHLVDIESNELADFHERDAALVDQPPDVTDTHAVGRRVAGQQRSAVA
jgi:hypothetical protein